MTRNNPAREALTRAVNRAIANGAPVYENVPDHGHLIALQDGLAHERERLANAASEHERALRRVWIAQREREIEAEKVFLNLEPIACDLTDDELLAELTQ